MIFLDIETIPLESSRERLLSTVGPPKSIKKAETLLKWEEEERPAAEDEAFRSGALQAMYGRVLMATIAIDDDEPAVIYCEDERQIISQLSSLLPDSPETIVGHNVIDFDLPFLWQRSKILSQPLPRWWPRPNAASWKIDVFDTMVEWSGRYGRKAKLDDLCFAFGVKSPKEHCDGSQVYDLYLDGKTEELKTYAIADVEAVREIYWRMV